MTKEEVYNKLKEKKYRITENRQKLIELFYSDITRHFTIDEIIEEMNSENKPVNVASVYNNLNIFKKEKIILGYDFQNKKCFEVNHSMHNHFTCNICQKTQNIDITLERKIKELEKEKKFVIEDYKINFIGICENCLKKERKKNENNK